MLCGIDEAGRGCLAGPLVVAGCVLNSHIEGLNDSKALSSKKREFLYEIIIKNAKYKIVEFSHEAVDKKGLSACLKDAVANIKNHFEDYEILMDGNTNFGVLGVNTLIKADSKIPEVSAASIIAKVTRDRFMLKMDKLYPEYEFAKHKGYGSALHVNLIKKYGNSPIHRLSFKIKSLKQQTLF